MTDTNELRKMLNECGVEWGANDTHRLLVTSWKDASGHDWAFMEHRDGNFSKLTAYHLTPAQAIAATLGSGTCKEVYLLMATDIGDGREEVLGVYATEEAAIAAINENQFGYALHHVRKVGVTS